ncbi:LuxR C-terminal-related transcriptional regulator [Arthrobacter gengyunqii]|uniref:LuxR C-terminal-related transcriptional regulator n=1 Tax=Arthrobacter gengyunqii TaxID=2886940 RepID=A0A9X1S6A9_9MICC|nr:LuxR C-terminal-related transcriptional regulator [Arthrobacter gengyunqii]MCC3269638.1 LuxR C-terminal-related transcriptional regulator [Arthrobacter gengyunqii]UOY97098.1 LuxR C-terminal-related transcriptional regulator [Arthrobacter gengyunqii]
MCRLVGRETALKVLAEALEAGRGGAVVVGPTGSGKTVLSRAAAADPDFYAITIRGSHESGKTSFGALAWLISDLPEGLASRPAQLLQELERLLLERAEGKRILLLLDGADLLDGLTVMVVSQLVRRSVATVLATVENLYGSAPEFQALWTEGLLHRVDLTALELEQTRELMEVLLQGQVSSAAAHALQRHSGGNPHLITLLTREQAGEGALVEQNGVWVLAKPLVFSGQVAEVMTVRLKRRLPAERALIQLLALSGELPLNAVLQLVPAETVDTLEEERMAEVTAAGNISLGAETSSEAIAASIPPGRSRELWEEVSAILDPASLGPSALLGFARWTLACGGKLDPQTAQRAAALSTSSGNPDEALRYVLSIHREQRTEAMVLEEVRALSALGEYRSALDSVERLMEMDGSDHPDSWAKLLWYRVSLLRILGCGDPLEVLEQARSVVLPQEADRKKRAALVQLVHGTLAIDTGCLSDVPPGLGDIASDPALPAATRALAGALQAQFLALSGRADQAMELLDAQMGEMTGDFPLPMSEAISIRVFQALIAAGEYARASALTDQLSDGGSPHTFCGSSADVAAGMVHALSGEADKALRPLASAMGQLQLGDPSDTLPTVLSLAAYAQLLLEHPEEAARLSGNVADYRCQPPAQFELVAGLLRVQVVLAGNPQQLCGELRSMARSRLDRGLVAPALECLAAAARHGDAKAAIELAEAAAQASGRWARVLYCFGAGLDRSDSALLVEAAEEAFQMGNVLLANTAARQALVHLTGRTGKAARVHARNALKVEHLSFRELRVSNTVEARMKTLTPFEAEIARRAAGPATRAEISKALNLSPRTIDWHLGKIFDKLHVSGRTELAEVLG